MQDLPSEIAMRRASHRRDAQVMPKCFAQKPGFYEVCEPAFYQGTPGASIFQMSCVVICHLFLQGTRTSDQRDNRRKGSRRGAHKVPMFGLVVCPRRRHTRRKRTPKAAWRMPHGHSEFANRAVDCRRRSESLWAMLIDRILNTAPPLSLAHRASGFSKTLRPSRSSSAVRWRPP